MITKTQIEHANILKQLHIKGNPLILFNIWDAGSAQAIRTCGAKAIATSSWSVATAHGYEDGEKLPFELVLSNIKRIVASVDLPVTLDMEGGYGQSPEELQDKIAKVIEAGVAGLNFEDQIIGSDALYSIVDQCERIRAVRAAAELASIPIFINARTDIFLKADPTQHEDNLEESIHRAIAYASAGADGFFVPGLSEPAFIEKLCARSPIPINIMFWEGMPSQKQIAELGVSRISYGPSPYNCAMNALREMVSYNAIIN
jgi:2-methylisocitrate lyase-like PEP mutase family enzyme